MRRFAFIAGMALTGIPLSYARGDHWTAAFLAAVCAAGIFCSIATKTRREPTHRDQARRITRVSWLPNRGNQP